MKALATGLALACAALGAGAQHSAGTAVHGTASHGHASPYAGEEERRIKALSAQELQAWLEGQGQGLARAAELNGYPGPMHVLELAAPLHLSAEQARRTRDLMEVHKAEASALGARLVEAERQLDLAFRERRASAAEVDRLTSDIASLQGRIRASHLRTHLAQAALLSPGQVAAYGRLRGYSRE